MIFLLELLTAHITACTVFFLVSLKKKDIYLFCKMTIVILMPLAGVLFFIILSVVKRHHRDIDTKRLFDLAESYDSADSGLLRKKDYRSEADIVPIDDALAVNSDGVIRKMVFDILKEDAFTYMEYLEKALKHKDTEISHYAATAVLDIQRKLMLALQDFSVKYEKDRENPEVLIAYSQVLKNYLSSSLIDERSKLKYKNIHSGVLADLLKVKPEPAHFVDKVNTELELKEYLRAFEYCNIFIKMYPGIEEPYLMLMKYYYIMKDANGLKDMVSSLKKSNCRFTNKALETVRYWWCKE